MPALASLLTDLFGPDGDPRALTTAQMAMRAVLAYGYGLALLRLGGPRILARYSAIDVVVAILLGSILSRVVNGSAPVGSSFVACAVVVAVQRLFAAIGWWSKGFGRVVKGRSTPILCDGEPDRRAMARLSVSNEDLEEAIRIAGHDPRTHPIEQAWLERDGRISVVPRRDASAIRNVHDTSPKFE